MMSGNNEAKPRGRPKGSKNKPKETSFKIKNIQELKDVVQYLKPLHVRRLSIGGIEIEFDVAAELMAREQQSLPFDDAEIAKENVKRGIAELLKEQEEVENWST